jgi:UDP-N-acetylglucosamine--N-acetylmuramyl-(pentapeptide) pyrophosphoryl-undecaprenol N-acetylglucosamine transferase
MEMERVPAAGYDIEGLPVSGFQRKLTLKNFAVLFNLFRSTFKAGKLLREFKPQIVIGVGGYASAPVLRVASRMGIPTLLQEQNSYAGVTNKLLARKALKICVAYASMEKYFPSDKLILTGNPVRQIEITDEKRTEALSYFGLSKSKPVLLIVGGSLGARTINEAILAGIDQLMLKDIQVIWQTGKYYYDEMLERLQNRPANLHITQFITRMDLGYSIADVMISRAGAISISEICLLGKASILVPSPNVAEDHQTKNAMALVQEDAAIMVPDKEAIDTLAQKALDLLEDKDRIRQLEAHAKQLAKPDATKHIVDEIEQILAG